MCKLTRHLSYISDSRDSSDSSISSDSSNNDEKLFVMEKIVIDKVLKKRKIVTQIVIQICWWEEEFIWDFFCEFCFVLSLNKLAMKKI